MLSPEQSGLSVELAKCLKLVAPVSMMADAQLSWIASAIDALEGIRAAEVAAISAELRRTVTRPAQIVPEIARMVAERRARLAKSTNAPSTKAADERRIEQEAQDRRAKATTQAEVEAAWLWERNEKLRCGLYVMPIAPPLTRSELDSLPDHLVKLGLETGLLARRGGQLVEINQRVTP
jgi:hypothetical protein